MPELHPAALTVSKSPASPGRLRVPGEIYLLVLDGAVTLLADTDPPLILKRGDGVHFNTQRGFALTTEDAAPSKVLLIHQGQRLSQDQPSPS